MDPSEASDRTLIPVGDLRVLGRGVTLACGVCGRRGLFRRWVTMVDDCPRCGLHFERVEGHWLGAVGINTVITFGLMILALAAVFIASAPDAPAGWWVVALTLGFGLVPLILYPVSKTLWTAIDLLMRPPERSEIREPSEWS